MNSWTLNYIRKEDHHFWLLFTEPVTNGKNVDYDVGRSTGISPLQERDSLFPAISGMIAKLLLKRYEMVFYPIGFRGGDKWRTILSMGIFN